MTTRELILSDFVRKVITATINEQRDKGITASGKSAQSLRFEADEESAVIFGEGYFESQEEGRGPSKGGGGWSDPIADIKEWMSYKSSFSGLSEKEKEQVAGAIVFGPKGIHKAGTSLYQSIKGTYSGSHRPEPLKITDIVKVQLPFLIKKLEGDEVKNIRSEIIRAWQRQ